MSIDFVPFFVSLKLSLFTTIILLLICFPLALLFAFRKFRFKSIIESLISLPLILPPTIIGFYLLLFLSPRGFIGSFLENIFNIRLVFSFAGIVIASCIYSFPFMLQPLKNGLEGVDKNIIEASYTLGKGRITTFFKAILPNMIKDIYSGIVMTFAHTMGEFGVILMIGGNIPGQTRVASIAIYDKVEQLDYKFANIYSLILIFMSIFILISLNILKSKKFGGKSSDRN
ncbi:MAG: molybdenum ABC transporter permease subunit [Spirochaetes bacterium GWD1_27_9]|nr:MAG: molybdenum ABC transporter permease subunit [Spirochaetes bacterium GWB1_27_13]OHD30993.1 MAG: molybdenum ABC transporter permease subunit [Spirochaetes bacterium GWD1_27_9]